MSREAKLNQGKSLSRLHSHHRKLALQLSRWFAHHQVALASRLALSGVFLQSGRTKVEGWMTVTPGAVALFESEYRLPLISPELGAHLAAYAEHVLPLMLVLGLCTRLSALALLLMTLVIQVFVYPLAWPTHLSWAALLMYLAARGAGRWSLDRRLGLD